MPRPMQAGEAVGNDSYNSILTVAHSFRELTDALHSARLELVGLDEQMRLLAQQAQGNPEAVKLYRALEARRPAAFHIVCALDSLMWLLSHEGGGHGGR